MASAEAETSARLDLPTINRTIALDFLDAIVGGDIDRCAALLHPDAAWWVQGWGNNSGANFLHSLSLTIARSSSRVFRIGLVTAQDDRVAVQAEGIFAFAEGAYANSYHYLFEIVDRRIRKGYEYLDTQIAAAFFATTRPTILTGETM